MPLAGTTSVIIVAADSGDGLIAGARRVLAADAPLQLIVSDNASSDGSIGQLQREFGGDARLRHHGRGEDLPQIAIDIAHAILAGNVDQVADPFQAAGALKLGQ